MKLVMSPTSPYARKVRIVALEKKISLELIKDSPSNPDTNVPDFNPLGKVPVLIMDNGETLYDSRVIVEYLDYMAPANSLLSDDHDLRIEAKLWESLADGVCDAFVLEILENRRPAALQSDAWKARQRSKIDRGMAALSKRIAAKSYCVADEFGLGDIALACLLGFLDLRGGEINFSWRETYPNLVTYYDHLMQRSSLQETQPSP